MGHKTRKQDGDFNGEGSADRRLISKRQKTQQTDHDHENPNQGSPTTDKCTETKKKIRDSRQESSDGLRYDSDASVVRKVVSILDHTKQNIFALMKPENKFGDGCDIEITDILHRVDDAFENLRSFKSHFIAVLGDNKIGKSFLINIILHLTESTSYGQNYLAEISSETQVYDELLASLEGIKEIRALRGFDDLEGDLNIRWLKSEDMESEDWKKKIESEKAAVNAIQNFAGNPRKNLFKKYPFQFMLPVAVAGGKSGSTTADIIPVGYGPVYHFVSMFADESDLLDELRTFEWAKYSDEASQGNLKPYEESTWNVMLEKYLIVVKNCDKESLPDEVESLKEGSEFWTQPFEVCNPKIKEALGKCKVVSGRGLDALDDRIFVRDALHELLCDRELAVVLESLRVYCPSDLLAEGIILADVPGTNDTDPRKYKLVKDAVDKADTVLVICKDNLHTSRTTVDMMRETSLFSKMLSSPDETNVLMVSLSEESSDPVGMQEIVDDLKVKTLNDLRNRGLDDTLKCVKRELNKELRMMYSGDRSASQEASESISVVLDKLKKGYLSCRILLFASLITGIKDLDEKEDTVWSTAVDASGGEILLHTLLALPGGDLAERVGPFVEEIKSIHSDCQSSMGELSQHETADFLRKVSAVCRMSWGRKTQNELEGIERPILHESFYQSVVLPTLRELNQTTNLEIVMEPYVSIPQSDCLKRFCNAVSKLDPLQINESIKPENGGRYRALDIHGMLFGSIGLKKCVTKEGHQSLEQISNNFKERLITRLKDWTTQRLIDSICGVAKRIIREPQKDPSSSTKCAEHQRTNSEGFDENSKKSIEILKAIIRQSVSQFFNTGVNSTLHATLRTVFSASDNAAHSFSSNKALKDELCDAQKSFLLRALKKSQQKGKTSEDLKIWMEKTIFTMPGKVKSEFLSRLGDSMGSSVKYLMDRMEGNDPEGVKPRRGYPLFLFLIRNSLRPLLTSPDFHDLRKPAEKQMLLTSLLNLCIEHLSHVLPSDYLDVRRVFWGSKEMAARRLRKHSCGETGLSLAKGKLAHFVGSVPLAIDSDLGHMKLGVSDGKHQDVGEGEFEEYWRGRLGLEEFEKKAELRFVVGRTQQDGNCLFESLAHFLCEGDSHSGQDLQSLAVELRQKIVSYVADHHRTKRQQKMFSERFPSAKLGAMTVQKWVARMKNPGEWGDIVVIDAFARMNNVTVLVHTTTSPGTPMPFPLDHHVSSFPLETSATSKQNVVNIAWIGSIDTDTSEAVHYVPLIVQDSEGEGPSSEPIDTQAEANLKLLLPETQELVLAYKVPLAFDIDETLITSGCGRQPRSAVLCKDLGFPDWGDHHYMLLRPCIIQSLCTLSKYFLLGICTAASRRWADCFLALLHRVGKTKGLDTSSLFLGHHICAIEKSKFPGALKSFQGVFSEHNADICLAVDDQDCWLGDQLGQVVSICSFERRMHSSWNDDEFVSEVKGLEQNLMLLRKTMLEQFGLGPRPGQPPRSPVQAQFGISMASILESVTPGLSQAAQLASAGGGSDHAASQRVDDKVALPLSLFMDEGVVLRPPGGRDFFQLAHDCGVPTWILDSVDRRLERLRSSRNPLHSGPATAAQRARRELMGFGDPVAIQPWDAEREAEIRRAAGGRREKRQVEQALALALAAQAEEAAVVTDSQEVTEACREEGVPCIGAAAAAAMLRRALKAGKDRTARAVAARAAVMAESEARIARGAGMEVETGSEVGTA